jgi:predicted helicase
LDNITESCFFESSFANNSIFPLYLYSGKEKTLNFSKQFSDFINEQYKSAFTPEEILSYIYAVLHSPTYRSKYAEFLKIDFPRIPFTDDKKLFKKLSVLGEELINVHLLKEEPDYSFGIFIGKGNNVVEKINFVSEKKSGKLYINDTQYFDNIPQEIYDFNIGGYQVLDHYLKERKGRNILLDIENIEKSVKAIAHTIDQMKKIDTLTKNWI